MCWYFKLSIVIDYSEYLLFQRIQGYNPISALTDRNERCQLYISNLTNSMCFIVYRVYHFKKICKIDIRDVILLSNSKFIFKKYFDIIELLKLFHLKGISSSF